MTLQQYEILDNVFRRHFSWKMSTLKQMVESQSNTTKDEFDIMLIENLEEELKLAGLKISKIV